MPSVVKIETALKASRIQPTPRSRRWRAPAIGRPSPRSRRGRTNAGAEDASDCGITRAAASAGARFESLGSCGSELAKILLVFSVVQRNVTDLRNQYRRVLVVEFQKALHLRARHGLLANVDDQGTRQGLVGSVLDRLG